MVSDPKFVHLNVHSKYSILEGILEISQITEACLAHNMPAVALTDSSNMFAALAFAKKCSEKGIQPIQGMQVPLKFRDNHLDPFDPSGTAFITVLVQNFTGYQNLLKLNSKMYLDQDKLVPFMSLGELKDFQEGLICLTGGSEGPGGLLLRDESYTEAKKLVSELAGIFSSGVYQEIQRHTFDDSTCTLNELKTESGFIDIAYELGLPLVATNNVILAKRDDYESVDMLFYIKNGGFETQKDARRILTPEHFFKSQEMMLELFEDLPEAINNTLEIAKRCSFHSRTRAPMLPKFCDDESEELKKRAVAGLKSKISKIELADTEEAYFQRLEYELGVINSTNFAGYFLIVADFVCWAKDNGIPVGPGRGSGAGSLVAYALNITTLDPIRYSLLFERFLNTERLSFPDFDIDFCSEKRDEVIGYVSSRYGEDRVAQIVTFGSLGAKNAIRDFGRILRVPRHLLNLWASEIDPRMPFKEQRRSIEVIRTAEESNPYFKKMFDQIEIVEGIPRNTSRHPGGIVISNKPMKETVPLYHDKKQALPVTQFDLKWVEEAGLVKMDFLGVKTLTVISKALEKLAKRGMVVDIDNVSLEDKKTFELYASGKTMGVFQVEGVGMTNALKLMKPTRFEDIIAMVALYRPGPMEIIGDFCAVKNGTKKAQKLHKSIDYILEETNGFIVYQEQVMEIVRQMAGYSLGRADVVRRIMGKKIPAEMEKEKPNFFEGAKGRQVPEATVQKVWDQLEAFAHYGFNKSHAAVYALVSYQTAWLKANHLLEYMSAVMTLDLSDVDKLASYVRELKNSGVEIIVPDINRSNSDFEVEEGKIIYALAAIKSVGFDLAKKIEQVRGDEPFKNMFDFAERVDLSTISKGAYENMVRGGIFDSLDPNRQKLFKNYDILSSYAKSLNTGVKHQSLFDDLPEELPKPSLGNHQDWNEAQRLAEEHISIGFYLSEHPISRYKKNFSSSVITSIATILDWQDNEIKDFGSKRTIMIAGIITKVTKRTSNTGKPMAFIKFSDDTGDIEALLAPDVYALGNTKMEENTLVYAKLETERYKDQIRVSAFRVSPIEELVKQYPIKVQIHFDKASVPNQVKSILKENTGNLANYQWSKVVFSPFCEAITDDLAIEITQSYKLNKRVKQAIKSLNGVIKVSPMD